MKLVTRIILAVSTLLAVSCGEPLAPRMERWSEVAAFPSTTAINDLAVAAGDVVFCAGVKNEGSGRAAIYRYAGGGIDEFFVSPYEEGGFYGVDTYGDYVWAAGTKKLNDETDHPYLVRYDGRQWKEIEVPGSVTEPEFSGVFAAAADFCWLSTNREIYTFDNGVWQKRLAQSGPHGLGLTVSPGGRAYAFFEGSVLEPWLTVYISDDRGETWVRENPKLDTGYYGLGSRIPTALTTRGESVCWGEDLGLLFEPRDSDPTTSYHAVIARDEAPPGEGSYDIAFMAPYGPYFYNIRDLAFRDSDNGYVVGTFTSVALGNGRWTLEVIPESLHPHFKNVAVGATRYWALGTRYASGADTLYAAPIGR
jgi:hypothetical protein